jgi:hypothetical protein
MKKQTVFSFRDPNNGGLMVKQYEFFSNVLAAARRQIPERIFHFGGGIRGGKTFTCLFTLLCIAKEYPGVKIHIVRDSMPNCIRTVRESLLKLCKNYAKFYQGKDNPYIELHNGSRIFFFAENFDRDKDLDRFKGLETNIFFLEQIEELQEKTFNKAIERVGTWLQPNMPPGLILTTFNPTHVKWIRDMVYKPYKSKKPLEGHYTVMATAKDNPHIPADLWSNWKLMDSQNYQTYVEGDWEVGENLKAYCYAFNPDTHVTPVKPERGDVYISFDFNVDPAVCLMAKVGHNFLHIFKEFRIRNSNVYELCAAILQNHTGGNIFITGDSSGNSRNHAIPDNLTTYDILRKALGVTRHNTHVPNKNLGLRDSRLVTNSVLENFDVRIDPSCEFLIDDLLTVEADEKGQIEKSKDPLKSHLLDCFRYYCNTYFLKQILGARYDYGE